ncbi:MAG: dihydropteroate synthase [Candidatus Omnitrophica bacterium]|nr:dihydropteroate synthase [Candidatus Omnitrophota bacterium]
MGVVNLTPDSFSGDGLFLMPEEALSRVSRFVEEGADIIDIGAVSTRPGAAPVCESDEIERLMPVLNEVCKRSTVPLSVDTTSAQVAERALQAGCHFVNDISGLRFNPEMAGIAARFGAGLILTHSRGTPATMQHLTQYTSLLEEICHELENSVRTALRQGVERDSIVIDPGFGFAKNMNQNYEVLANLETLKRFERPILVGPSRKSFIGAATGKEPKGRLSGTLAACALAVSKGADIVRVHDVAETRDALRVSEEVLKYVCQEPSLLCNGGW